MRILTTRGRLLASSVLCGALTFGAVQVASAQTAAGGAAATASTAEIVVTGTRIRGAANATSASPISVATKAQIELTKSDTIEDVLTHLTGPDFNGGTSAASNNGGDGVSNVGLRNLGPSRTLVLIDGQRIIPTLGSLVDLNVVPLSMVDSLQVLRDGASSVYGADAIGGVINIITKKNFNGVDASASYGESGHGDGATYSVSSTVGVNSDKGNIILTVGWDHRDAISQANRSWATDSYASIGGGSAYRGQINILQEEYGETDGNSYAFANGNKYNIADPTVNWGAIDPALAFINDGANSQVKMNAGNTNWNDLTSGLDRKQLSFSAHYDLTDNVKFVTSGFYTDSNTNQQLRPEPLLGDAIGTSVWAGFFIPNDQLPASIQAVQPNSGAGQSNAFFLTPNQFGPRTYDQESQTYRLKVGLEGTLFGKYDWEAGYVYQGNTTDLNVYNEGNFYNMAQILEQTPCVSVPGGCHANASGMMVPNVTPNWTNGPNNIFTPAQVAFLTFDNTSSNQSSENYAYANIGGPIWQLPAGELKGSVGAEVREEHLINTPNPLTQEGWTPNQSQTTAGGYDVASVYGEFEIPIVKDLPFIQMLTLNPSARYDNYSTFGGAYTNGVKMNWTVNKDLRIRFSYNTGFRAPQVAELFGGQGISDISADGDPCDTRAAGYGGNSNIGKGVLTAGSTCSKALAGVAGAENGSGAVINFQNPVDSIAANQMQVLEGGNPKLEPETAETYSYGFVFTPHWVPGLSFDVDYYSVRVSNTIFDGGIAGNISPDVVLNGCYGSAQSSFYCSQITRNATTGAITQVNSLNVNYGTQIVQGVDYQIDYDTAAAHLNLPIPGSFRFDLQVSNLINNLTQVPGGTPANSDNPGSATTPQGGVEQHAGHFDYSNENYEPKWKATAAVDYRLGPWTAHWDVRYMGQATNVDGTTPGFGNLLTATWYNSIAGSYSFSDFGALKKARITFGIDNIADVTPPFLTGDSICKCNTLAGPYDVVGRFFYGRISTSF